MQASSSDSQAGAGGKGGSREPSFLQQDACSRPSAFPAAGRQGKREGSAALAQPSGGASLPLRLLLPRPEMTFSGGTGREGLWVRLQLRLPPSRDA